MALKVNHLSNRETGWARLDVNALNSVCVIRNVQSHRPSEETIYERIPHTLVWLTRHLKWHCNTLCGKQASELIESGVSDLKLYAPTKD
jgi:hypothetical protein